MRPQRKRQTDDVEQPEDALSPDTPVDEQTGVDARKDPGKLKENRDKLGVNEEHKTEEMQKGHRGTFP